jgi:hypothetical protein
MASRLVAVVLVAGLGIGVWIYGKQIEANEPPEMVESIAAAENEVDTVQSQAPPFKFPESMKGVTPDGPPVFNVDVELRMKGDQPNLHFTVTEQHGWAADHVELRFWHQVRDENGEWKQVGKAVPHLCRTYLDLNGVLSDWTTPLELEFPDVEDWGTSENWEGRVTQWNGLLAPAP